MGAAVVEVCSEKPVITLEMWGRAAHVSDLGPGPAISEPRRMQPIDYLMDQASDGPSREWQVAKLDFGGGSAPESSPNEEAFS